MVDVDAEAIGSEQLDGEHFRARDALFDSPGELLLELPFLCVNVSHRPSYRHKKWAPRAHFAKPVKCGAGRIARRDSRPPARTPATTVAPRARLDADDCDRGRPRARLRSRGGEALPRPLGVDGTDVALREACPRLPRGLHRPRAGTADRLPLPHTPSG